jgi:hypothetical protein
LFTPNESKCPKEFRRIFGWLGESQNPPPPPQKKFFSFQKKNSAPCRIFFGAGEECNVPDYRHISIEFGRREYPGACPS